jgi:hypothetical protein
VAKTSALLSSSTTPALHFRLSQDSDSTAHSGSCRIDLPAILFRYSVTAVRQARCPRNFKIIDKRKIR